MIIYKTFGSRVFDGINYLLLLLIGAGALYPVIYVFSLSVSDPQAVLSNRVFLYPIGFDLTAYEIIIQGKTIPLGFRNSFVYTSVGTMVNLIATILTAYPLSKKKFFLRGFWMVMIVFTMYFSGGLIPSYLLVIRLGLIDSMWALILPGAIGTYNLIIMRTFFKNIPAELEESAVIDGAGDFRVLWQIVVPLSKAAIATIGLFYAVGHWNSFFSALIYLNSPSKYPLQLILREIILAGRVNELAYQMVLDQKGQYFENTKYGTLIVTILPMILLYPWLQKYFIKGVMIGALKG